MNKIIKTVLLIVSFIVIWHLIVTIFNIPKYILPSPVLVINVFFEKYFEIFSNSTITIYEALFGFIIANSFSILIALCIAFNKKLENYLVPLAVALKTIPIIAITPLLLLWLGPGEISKVATAGLICFFPSLVTVLRGVKCLDRDLLRFFKANSADKIQLTQLLIIPSILPYLFASLKVSSSLAIVGALVGEFIGSNKGLGFLIVSNYYTLNTPMVFACIITTSLIGIIFYYVIQSFERKIITWTDSID